MNRSGKYITQLRGYKSFFFTPLPPQPPLKIDTSMSQKIERATLLLAQLDGLAYLLPNTDLFISMYVKKEALLDTQIEGTQASLTDIFDYESGATSIENINDIKEVINYVKALDSMVLSVSKHFPSSHSSY